MKDEQACIQFIRKYANDHYNEGWDLVVEAYNDGDLLEELSEHNFDLKKTIQSLQDTIDLRKQLMEEHQAEARQSY